MQQSPDTDIAAIEKAIRDSRLTGADVQTEMFLSRRAHNRMLDADIAGARDNRVKGAFLAGYRMGADGATTPKMAFYGAMIGTPVLGILLVREFIAPLF